MINPNVPDGVKPLSLPPEELVMPTMVPLTDNKAYSYACRCPKCGTLIRDPVLGKACARCDVDIPKGEEKHLTSGNQDMLLCQACHTKLTALVGAFLNEQAVASP